MSCTTQYMTDRNTCNLNTETLSHPHKAIPRHVNDVTLVSTQGGTAASTFCDSWESTKTTGGC